MAELNDREEQYIFRVQDRALAGRIRGLLQSGSLSDLSRAGLQLNFSGEYAQLRRLGPVSTFTC